MAETAVFRFKRASNLLFWSIFIQLSLVSVLSAQTQMLKQVEAVPRAGVIIPQNTLSGYLDPAPLVSVVLFSSYFKNLNAVIGLDYALFDGLNSPRSFHYLKSGAGIMYLSSGKFLPSAGITLDIHFIRSYELKTDERLLMDHNESEFGVSPFAGWKIPLPGKYSLHLQGSWSVIFSKPVSSSLLSLYAGLGYSLW